MKSLVKKATVYQRYYHVFKKDELEDLISEIDCLKLRSSYYDKDNWCVICEKV